MTAEASGHSEASDRNGRLGPLGHRLLAAFLLVALSSVAVLTAAALVGSNRGLAAARQADRGQAATRVATAAAEAYAKARGWEGADLQPAHAMAAAAGARLTVWDATGRPITSAAPGSAAEAPGMGPGGTGMGNSAEHGTVHGTAHEPVVSGGVTVGSVRLAFGTPASTGRTIAWSWILLAALTAIAVAVAASWFVTRRLTRPLVRLAAVARALAAGDRSARSQISSPGELGQLAVTFDRMATDLNWAEQTRRHLAADIAHELRTPLAGLQAGLEELRDGLAQPDPARLASLHDQALRLGRVVDDLAELSAAESAAQTLRLADVDLTTITHEALTAHQPRLHTAGLALRTDLNDGLIIRADADRLHQALGNLLANAARYCRPGDTVMVATYEEDHHAVVTVTDTGPGIPTEDLPHVFDRLWRGRHNHGVGSTGIGLAVVRELVTAHHGTVTATSKPGHGATFTIRLPMQPTPAQ